MRSRNTPHTAMPMMVAATIVGPAWSSVLRRFHPLMPSRSCNSPENASVSASAAAITKANSKCPRNRTGANGLSGSCMSSPRSPTDRSATAEATAMMDPSTLSGVSP